MDAEQFKQALQQREDELSELVDKFIETDLLDKADPVTGYATLTMDYLPEMDFGKFQSIMSGKGFSVEVVSDLVKVGW